MTETVLISETLIYLNCQMQLSVQEGFTESVWQFKACSSTLAFGWCSVQILVGTLSIVKENFH